MKDWRCSFDSTLEQLLYIPHLEKVFIWLLLKVVDFLHFLRSSTRLANPDPYPFGLLMYCSIVSAIASSSSSSSEYSLFESRLNYGDINSSRLSDLKCLFDDRNSRSGSL
ncbi:hypothetical protein Tco_1407096 [Tanacetum coccineum]